MASENSVNYYYWLVSGMALCSLYYMEGLRKLKMFSPMVFAHAAWGWGGYGGYQWGRCAGAGGS